MPCRDCVRETKGRLQLCSRCGSLRGGGTHFIQRMLQKQSQLARFGLAGVSVLLKRAG